MKEKWRLHEGQDPKVEGQKRRRLLYPLAILTLLALCCVPICPVANLAQLFSKQLWGVKHVAGESREEAARESLQGSLGLEVYGQAIQVMNMAPGDRVTSGFTLENSGLDPIRVVVTSRLVSDNGLCQALLISLVRAGQGSGEESDVIYYGPLMDLYRKPAEGLRLPANGGERLIWSVHLPFESGNEYQASQCRVYFVFEGQQI